MFYEHKFFGNSQVLGSSGQEKVRRTLFCVIGLGGTGGFALESLVRMGAERFILFDHDRFELGNFNRQLLATDYTLDRKKTDAAVERARSINQKIKIKKFGKFDSKKANVIADADILIDATDNLATKFEIAKACRKEKVPYVFCSAQGSRGIVSVFMDYPFEKAFQVDKGKLDSKSCSSVLCPVTSLAGSLVAAQAVNMILKKPVVRAPEALFFDIFDSRLFWKGRLG